MTLWNNENELKEFARNGAHLDAMKKSKNIAKEIRTITIDADAPAGARVSLVSSLFIVISFLNEIIKRPLDTLNTMQILFI